MNHRTSWRRRDLPRRSHLQCRSESEPQHLAQRAQIRITRPNAIILPEKDARRADTDLHSDFYDRQATLDAGVTQMLGKLSPLPPDSRHILR